MRRRLIQISLFTLAIMMSSLAMAADESPFYSQCHRFLPAADDFAKTCLQKARPFSRTFRPGGGSRGEVESYSAYFQKLDAPSHFVLGCVLNFKHQLSYVGMYYSTRPLDMTDFDTDPIAFIDPNDNVGVVVDGQEHALIAVRQFATDFIPPHLNGPPRNCERVSFETINGSSPSIKGPYLYRKVDDLHLERCLGDLCSIEPYIAVFGLHQSPIIYDDTFAYSFQVDESGVLIMTKTQYQFYCSRWNGRDTLTGVSNIFYEACSGT